MTAFSNAVASTNPQYAYSADMEPAKAGIVCEHQVPAEQLRTYTFPQKFFPIDGGSTVLRLREPLSLVVDEISDTFFVKGWDIKLPTNQVYDLPRQVARKFLYYFSKADSRQLSPGEEVKWGNILDTVDSTQFIIDRSAPHYVEGRVIHHNPTQVEWADGQTERLNHEAAAALLILEPGDNFSGYAKLGRNNEVRALSRVSLVEVSV